MKYIIITFLLFTTALANPVKAQQRLRVSQYMVNNYLINPAITGIYGTQDIKIGYRNQWIGIEGGPKSFYLTAHTNFILNEPSHTLPIRGRSSGTYLDRNTGIHNKSYNSLHGVGLNISTENLGPTIITSAFASYAFHLRLSTDLIVSLGMSSGFIQYSTDSEKFNLPDKHLDPTMNSNNLTLLKPDLNIGVWLYSKKFYVGLSSYQILRNKTNDLDYIIEDPGRMVLHSNMTAGYKISLDQIDLIPSVLVSYVKEVPLAVDLNLRANYKNFFWAGISYRYQDAVIGLLGVTINDLLNVSYSYDITTSNLNNYSNGSQEIMLGIRLSGNKSLASTFY